MGCKQTLQNEGVASCLVLLANSRSPRVLACLCPAPLCRPLKQLAPLSSGSLGIERQLEVVEGQEAWA